MVVFQSGEISLAVDSTGRVVARGRDTDVLQYALDNYSTVFIRRGWRPYVVEFRRLVPWWGTFGHHQVGDFAFRVCLEAVGDKVIVSDGAVLRRADGANCVVLYARNYERFVVAGVVFDGNRSNNSPLRVDGRVWPFDGYAELLTGGCATGGEMCHRSGLVMWDVAFVDSPGWSFYLGNHAPEELGYRREACDRFAYLYNVRVANSRGGVVFDNVRDSVVVGLFINGSDGNCVTVMGNPGAVLNLYMSYLILRECVRRPLSIGGDMDVAGLAVVGGVEGVVVEGLDVESRGLGVGVWGGLVLRGGRIASRPPPGWSGNVIAWSADVADVTFSSSAEGEGVGAVLVEDGGVARRFYMRGVSIEGAGLVYKPQGGSLLLLSGSTFSGSRGLHANVDASLEGELQLSASHFNVADFAVSVGLRRWYVDSVTTRCSRGVFCVGLWGGKGVLSADVMGGGVALLVGDVRSSADMLISGSFSGTDVGIWVSLAREESRASCWSCGASGGLESLHVERGSFEYCGSVSGVVRLEEGARVIWRCA